ncbi:MAG TPA: betaine/proline/choline family ABC transporter ATP-binding protein [Clostridiaceae bacterium]|nr:betaine/proline/choline family ABC transporter ATP-binding protein [Clostridiaceae bacterium]
MIELKNIYKKFPGGSVALNNVSFTVEKGEFVSLIGPSGCGKTTCLRTVNRMTELTGGSILINGKNINDLNPTILRRSIGYVVQQIGLMPHMTIYENLITVPKLLKWPEEELKARAHQLIRYAELPEEYLKYYPAELSGGQQQRIGVMRAIAAKQKIVLMDEPFGALDPVTRNALQNFIIRWHNKLNVTVIFVTHDMDEALKLSDKIVIMNKGEIVQYDTPENLFNNPVNGFVEEFVGAGRHSEGQLILNALRPYLIPTATVNITSTVEDTLEIQAEQNSKYIYVVDDDEKLIGYIDADDISEAAHDMPISDYVKDTAYADLDTNLKDVLFLLKRLDYKHIPVVDADNKFQGLITVSSISSQIHEQLLDSHTPPTSIKDTCKNDSLIKKEE